MRLTLELFEIILGCCGNCKSLKEKVIVLIDEERLLIRSIGTDGYKPGL
jgi:hypothetical protein